MTISLYPLTPWDRFQEMVRISREWGCWKGRKVGLVNAVGSQSPLFPGLPYHPKEEDVVIEDFEEDSEAEGSGGEDDIRELRAKKLALARKIAEQQRRQEKIQVGPAWGGWFPVDWLSMGCDGVMSRKSG